MEKTWCLKDGDYTPCVEPSGYQRDKRNRLPSVAVKKLDM